MLVVREIMYCKPGKVRPLLEKFIAMDKLGRKIGFPKMRIMTDVAGERYWTLVSEMEVENWAAFEKMMSGDGYKEEDMKEFETLMTGYHDLVDHGRREIFKLEGWVSWLNRICSPASLGLHLKLHAHQASLGTHVRGIDAATGSSDIQSVYPD